MKTSSEESNHRIFSMQRVIAKLREDDLKQGNCFMIFDDALPEDQAYYEYPDGTINIEQIDRYNLTLQRQLVRTLSYEEIAVVKQKNAVFK